MYVSVFLCCITFLILLRDFQERKKNKLKVRITLLFLFFFLLSLYIAYIYNALAPIHSGFNAHLPARNQYSHRRQWYKYNGIYFICILRKLVAQYAFVNVNSLIQYPALSLWQRFERVQLNRLNTDGSQIRVHVPVLIIIWTSWLSQMSVVAVA